MQILESWLTSIIYFGAGLAGLFGLGQWFYRTRSGARRVHGAFLLSLGVVLGHAGLLLSGDITVVPHLYLAHTPFLFAFGPLLAGYFRALSGKTRRVWLLDLGHLLPGIAAVVVLTPLLFMDAESKLALIRSHLGGQPELRVRIVLSLGLLSFLGYGIYTALIIGRLTESGSLVENFRLPLIILLAYFSATAVVTNIGSILQSRLLLLVGYSSGTGIVVGIYFINERFPDFVRKASGELRRRSGLYRLRGFNVDTIEKRLRAMMEAEHAYRDEELDLEQLAGSLDIAPEQLSQLLNKRLSRNFNSFVNEYRIREACAILKDNPEARIIDVAYRVGFASVSAFHQAFRRFVGVTPRQYRQTGKAGKK